MSARRQLRIPEYVGSWSVVPSSDGSSWITLGEVRTCSRPLCGSFVLVELPRSSSGEAPSYTEILKSGVAHVIGSYNNKRERVSVALGKGIQP